MMFKDVAEKFKDKPALNDISYGQLLDMIEHYKFCREVQGSGDEIALEILSAAANNCSLSIPPLDRKDYVPVEDYIDRFGIYLYTSGSTTNIRRPIFLSEKFLLANFEQSVKIQSLNNNDIIYNVSSMNHTGGINIQVLPALLTGATVYIEHFDPRNFFKRLTETRATLTHLTPRMLDSLVNNIKPMPCHLRLLAAGSDCVKKQHVEYWLDNGIDFVVNYGLTEAGPWIINHRFTDHSELEIFDQGVPLGSTVCCDHQLIEQQLYLKGSNVSHDDWLPTGDCVEYRNGFYFYNGRISAGCQIINKRY